MNPLDLLDPRLRTILVTLLVTVLGTYGIVCTVTDDGGDAPPAPPAEVEAIVPEATVVDDEDQNAQPDDIVELGPKARDVLASYAENDGHDLAPETGDELRGDDETGPVAQLEPPFAAEEVPGCATRFLTTNFSDRVVPYPSGVIWITWHYTGGPDLPGTRADVTGLTGWGNNPAARVSWHFGMDKDGNCDYNVPLRYKSWAFGNANSRSYNIEVTGQGEAPYLRAGGYRQARRIVAYIREANPGIPIRIGAISNCAPGKPGMLTHYMGGPCSGGHTDIKPLDFAAFVAKLRCGERCRQRQRQRKVIAARVARHDATHKEARAVPCRSLDKHPPSAFRKPECRELKLKHRRQRASIRRARATLRAI